ncbi:MAG: tetratricopeptide (TPR) repeat protein [Rhodothermales bacterium]|jgi:tetratricopeptide (TPR) repeat protein
MAAKSKAQKSALRSSHCAIILVILVFAIYANSFGNAFTNWDDRKLSLNNLQVTEFDLVATFTPVPGHTFQPLRVLSYAIDFAIWGDNPLGYHLMNTLLHATASVLLFLAIARLLAILRPDLPTNRWVAFGVALLFACHPVNVEAVTWISSRKYGLLATFSFLSLYLFLRTPQKGMGVGSALAMALAMLSSPFGIVWPALFVLIDLCRGELRKRLPVYLPIGVAAVIVVPMILIGLFGGDGGPGVEHHVAGKPHWTFFTTLRVLFDYGVNLTLPLFLNNKYPNEMVKTLFAPGAIIGLFGLLALGWFVWRQWRSGDRLAALCVGWFVIAWLPVSNLVPTSTTMADRYLYLPAVGIFLGVALTLDELLRRRPALQQPVLIAAGVVLLAYSGLTVRRNTVWKNDLTLWADCLARNPDTPIGQNNYGYALKEAGDPEAAAPHFRRSLELFEPHSEAHQNLGVYLLRKKKWQEAAEHLRRAVEIRENYPAAWSNLGVCLMELGQTEEAARCFNEASTRDPRMVDYPLNHGVALAQLADFANAELAFDKALALERSVLLARQIGGTLMATKQFALALKYLRTAQELAPGDVSISVQVARCLAGVGKMPEAIQVLEAALRITPDNAQLAKMWAAAKAAVP